MFVWYRYTENGITAVCKLKVCKLLDLKINY